jgi:phage shock protein E
MNLESLQSYLFPLIIIGFFGYRFYRFKKVKAEIPTLLKDGAVLIDVRTSAEYSAGHNPQSINIPLDKLNEESKKLDKSKTVLLCCASGTRSGMAVGILKKNGFNNVLNAGPWSNTLT